MFYFDYRTFSIIEISPEDVIREFSEATTSPRGVEPKYFYENGAIWSWDAGGSRSHVGDYEEAEAQAKLLEWAIQDAVLNYSIAIHPAKADVLAELQGFIDDEGAWDLEDIRDIETRDRLITIMAEESA